MEQPLNTLSVSQVLERAAALAPEKTALVDGDRRKTYRELNEMATRLAMALSELGFKKGDRVAIYMKNCLEFVIAFYGLQKIGAVVAWVSPAYRRSEAEFILKNSQARAVFILREWEGHDYLGSIQEMRPELPDLTSVFVVGEGEGIGVQGFDDLVKGTPRGQFTPPSFNLGEDLSMLIYTSGTTGKPKGAMIAQTQVVKAGWEYSLGVNAGSEDVFIGFLPMSHSYGCGSVLVQPFLLVSSVVLMDKFDPKSAFVLIEKEKVTLQPGAPAHYLMELSHPERNRYDLSSLRAGLIAGQIAPEGLITRVEKEMGVYLTSFWGASEVGPGVGIMCPYPSPLEIREAYVGKPIAGTAVRIVDPETRQEVPDGQMGELTLKGWHVLKGYWNNPEETRKQIIDGWLHAGDLVSREKEGYLKIYGRTKDLINRGGYKVYPHELESLIIEHPSVQDVCVVATPNPILGESICACVIVKPGQAVTLKNIRDFLQGKIAPHKLPDELCIMKEFPRLSGGIKLKKFGEGGLFELARRDLNRERHRR
jgi:acyl-CoA synthetase (AMP-forming)/AMP-acid ligase II